MLTDELNYIRKLVEERSGISLSPDKAYLIESRLRKLLKEEQLHNLENLVGQLKWRRFVELHEKVVDALTTNETSFFRDNTPFETLRNEILPAIIRANTTSKRINIWSAACSSGQEPYSILMILREHFPSLKDWEINILATDLSNNILEKAREGYYTDFELGRGLPDNLKKYFDPVRKGWQFKPEMRQAVTFEQLNLIDSWPLLQDMDLILMRNVLIYFQPAVKESILQKTASVLRPEGYLILGQSETLVQLDTPFSQTKIGSTPYYKLATSMAL